AARMRVTVSTGPPAAYGTTRLIGRVGQSSAPAAPIDASRMAVATAIDLAMTRPPVVPGRFTRLSQVSDDCSQFSIRADAGRVHRLRPALDLLRQELGEVFGRAPLGRRDLEAELLQAPADRGVVQRVAHRLVELAHDRLGRALGQEECVPYARLNP